MKRQGGKKSLYSLETRDKAAEICLAHGGGTEGARIAAEQCGIHSPYLIIGWAKGRQAAIRAEKRKHAEAMEEPLPKTEADQTAELQYLEMVAAKLAIVYNGIHDKPVPESVKKAVKGAFDTTFRVMSVRLADAHLAEVLKGKVDDLRPFVIKLDE